MSFQINLSVKDGVPQVSTSGTMPKQISVLVNGHYDENGVSLSFNGYLPGSNLTNVAANGSDT